MSAARRRLGLWPAIVLGALLLGPVAAAGQSPSPPALSDDEFWRLVTELSEPGGDFQPQLMSNEDSAQFVLPDLERKVAPGGVYLGVGSEQNFTYVATLRPRIAFVVDIRRDNLLQMLLYKALFEVADSRASFVSRLFSRPLPPGLDGTASVVELFEAFKPVAPDAGLLARTSEEVVHQLTVVRGWPLYGEDRSTIASMLGAFLEAGAGGLRGYGDRNPSYAQLMAMTDLDGREQSYLASEARFAVVRDLQQRNIIVPVVGDFAGPSALAAIARELESRGDRVDVFYVSNVERYLWQRDDLGRPFYENVENLPLAEDSLFIRSLTTDISVRQSIPIPTGTARWRTLLFGIRECLDAMASGRIGAYRELFIPLAP